MDLSLLSYEIKIKMKRLLKLIIIILFCFSGTQCYYQYVQPKIIRIKGSDTVLILAQLWAQEYMKEHASVSVYVEGGGSATGFQALITNEVDIVAASRPMLAFEVRQLAEKTDRLGIAHRVAKDALSIYTNPVNTVSNLSIINLKKIFTGEITNWNEVGGNNDSITVLIRTPNSGTHHYFKDHVLNGGNYVENALILPTTNSITSYISENKNAIGYGGAAYGANIVHLKIEGIDPTLQNIQNDFYPITRYLYLYTVDTPLGEIKNFIDWVLSSKGQTLVAKSGYIPLY